jgi:hypothetical protein
MLPSWPMLPEISKMTHATWEVDTCYLWSESKLMLPEKLTHATWDQQADSCYLRSWPMLPGICKQTHAIWEVDPCYLIDPCYLRTETWPKLHICYLTPSIWDLPVDPCNLRSTRRLMLSEKMTHTTWNLKGHPCYLVDPCYLRSASWPMLSPARIRLSPYWHSSGPASSVINNIFFYAIVLQRLSLQFKKVIMPMYGERKINNWPSSTKFFFSCYYFYLYDLLILATETGKSHHFQG